MDRPVSKKIKLSIVIVSCDTTDLTLDCIRSIYQFKPSCAFEILLIDNGVHEIDAEQVDPYPELRLIRTGRNLGYAKANNLGIYNSHGDFIVLLNSDTKLLEKSFDSMLAYMEKNPYAGVLGVREVDGEGRYRLSCGAFPTFFSELTRKIWHYRLSLNDYNLRDSLDLKHSRVRDADWVSGSCMMLRRAALRDVGLLDENFFMYFEDIDLCSRFWKKKWEVHYFPDTSLMHYGGGSARQNLMLVMTEYRRSEIYFARKYYGYWGGVGIRVFLLLKYAVYFLTQFPLFLFQKMAGKNPVQAYTKALVAKKVVEIVFAYRAPEPSEPALLQHS